MFKKGFEKIAYLPKRPYKALAVEKLDPNKTEEAWTAKIDGAHTIVEMKKGERPRLFSHRISKRTGLPIEYTQKLPHIKKKSPLTAVLRAETFAVDKKGIVAHPDTVTAMLNRTLPRSKQLQKQLGLTTRTALIDVDRIDGKDASKMPFSEKRKYLEAAAKANPNFTVPAIAYTPEEKSTMLEEIKSGKHPETKEGVIVHDLVREGAPFYKGKLTDAHDVFVRRIFVEESPTGRKPMAGGIEYAWESKGEPIGRVGTGFDHATKEDMLKNPESYLGRVAMIKSPALSKNRVLMKPSFIGWHIDKNIDRPRMAKQTVIINKSLATDRKSAKGLAKMYADRLYTARETGPSFRFRQLPPDKFVEGTFRTFKPKEGVAVVYGQLKEASMFTKGFEKTAVSEKLYAKAVGGALKGADRATRVGVANRIGTGSANSVTRGMKNKMAKKNLGIRDRVIGRLAEVEK